MLQRRSLRELWYKISMYIWIFRIFYKRKLYSTSNHSIISVLVSFLKIRRLILRYRHIVTNCNCDYYWNNCISFSEFFIVSLWITPSWIKWIDLLSSLIFPHFSGTFPRNENAVTKISNKCDLKININNLIFNRISGFCNKI